MHWWFRFGEKITDFHPTWLINLTIAYLYQNVWAQLYSTNKNQNIIWIPYQSFLHHHILFPKFLFSNFLFVSFRHGRQCGKVWQKWRRYCPLHNLQLPKANTRWRFNRLQNDRTMDGWLRTWFGCWGCHFLIKWSQFYHNWAHYNFYYWDICVWHNFTFGRQCFRRSFFCQKTHSSISVFPTLQERIC